MASRRRSHAKPDASGAEPLPAAMRPSPRWQHDAVCVAVLLLCTLGFYWPALFGGKVLLPADIVPLMRPWSVAARDRGIELGPAQNQLLGPIFEYYSWRHYARERIRAGEVPLWNPLELSGNVLLANSQSAVLYPPNLLLYLLPLWQGINWVTALHTLLTGLFLYTLLRLHHRSYLASLVGALLWMFCAVQVVWTEFQTPTAALCWLPGALVGWEMYRRSGNSAWTVLGSGAAIALSLLAGHLQFAFYVALAFALYAVIRSRDASAGSVSSEPIPRRIPSRGLAGSIGMAAAALGFGALLSMAVMLPVLEMGRMNHRAANESYAAAVALRLPPANLLTLVLPNLYGNPRDYVRVTPEGLEAGPNYWGKFEFVEYAAYVGVVGLLLALLGIRARDWRRRSGAAAFASVALVGALLALGTPLCAFFFYLAPGYRQFHATGRAVCLLAFGLAALAAFGMDRVLGSERARAVRTGGLLAVLLGATCAVCLPYVGRLAADANIQFFEEPWRSYTLLGVRHALLFFLVAAVAIWYLARRPALGGALLLIAAAGDPVVALWGFNPLTNPDLLSLPTRTGEVLRSVHPARALSLQSPGTGIKSFIVPNYNAVVGYREVQGADSMHTRRYHALAEGLARRGSPTGSGFPEPNTVRLTSANHPMLDLLNVRLVTTDSRQSLPPSRFLQREQAELTIWENQRAFGQAWLATAYEVAHGAEAVLKRLEEPGFDPRQTAILEGVPATAPTPTSSPGSASIAHVRPHRIELTVETVAPAILVLSEPYFPGWRASVDGRPATLMPAFHVLTALPVPPGSHRVAITYEPASYRIGLFLSCLSAGGGTLWLMLKLASGRRAINLQTARSGTEIPGRAEDEKP